jgi:glutaredoxin
MKMQGSQQDSSKQGTKRLKGLPSLVLFVAVALGLSAAASAWYDRSLSRSMAAAQEGDILMYTTTDCPYCARAREWLTTHEVPFTECDTSVNAACQEGFARTGSPGVPTLMVRDQRMIGFDPQRVSRLLEK